MKKLLTLMLALMLTLSLAACGEKAAAPSDDKTPDPGSSQQDAADPTPDSEPKPDSEPSPAADSTPSSEQDASAEEPSGEELSAWMKTKTGKFYSRFTDGMYMEYEMEYAGSLMTVISASKGDMSYTESKVDGQSTGGSVMDGEYMYTIDHAGKTVIKMSLQTSAQEMTDTMIAEGDVDPAALVSGKREIDGKSYDTEEWELDGAKSILCFDGDTLAYMIGQFDGEEVVMKIIEISDKVDESLFEIPADYQVISF